MRGFRHSLRASSRTWREHRTRYTPKNSSTTAVSTSADPSIESRRSSHANATRCRRLPRPGWFSRTPKAWSHSPHSTPAARKTIDHSTGHDASSVCQPDRRARAVGGSHCPPLASNRTGGANRVLGADPRLPVELVDHVPVGAERVARIVAELARHVDHRAALVQQEAPEGMAQVVGPRRPGGEDPHREKTQTTAPRRAGVPQCRYRPGHSYGVRTGSAKPEVTRIKVGAAREAVLHELTDEDARAEGLADFDELLRDWYERYGSGPGFDRELPRWPFAIVPVWVITFELDLDAPPRLLGRRPRQSGQARAPTRRWATSPTPARRSRTPAKRSPRRSRTSSRPTRRAVWRSCGPRSAIARDTAHHRPAAPGEGARPCRRRRRGPAGEGDRAAAQVDRAAARRPGVAGPRCRGCTNGPCARSLQAGGIRRSRPNWRPRMPDDSNDAPVQLLEEVVQAAREVPFEHQPPRLRDAIAALPGLELRPPGPPAEVVPLRPQAPTTSPS
jgi:hypothetical protein